ncbi:AraC family transcriptional regulator [Flavobacteriaceae bacterium TP-CH-4]|uniref:AraC family transcriptional regulator n=1 Tax=Pelagihabitans pacificus TaxID=2696054 RepID=A0A967E7A8_9FLAO|nr:GyrI-like domain-containing protein [Pelagihabitans pacificus]NHF61397.1 AraC family transcriptional regulator [Pelagihabitans pacificus]
MEQVTIEPFKLIGISLRTTNENGRAAEEIGALWQQFMANGIIDRIPNKTDNAVYSLYTDYEGDHTKPYTVLLGCKVTTLETVPDGMVGRSFEGGNYVRITAKGDLTKGLILNQWARIWELDLQRRYTADFEVFGDKAQNPVDAEVDFLVAVE